MALTRRIPSPTEKRKIPNPSPGSKTSQFMRIQIEQGKEPDSA